MPLESSTATATPPRMICPDPTPRRRRADQPNLVASLGRPDLMARIQPMCSIPLRPTTAPTLTLRYLSRLRHIPVGAAHKNRRVRPLIAGADVRIVTEDGHLLLALTLDPTRSYARRVCRG